MKRSEFFKSSRNASTEYNDSATLANASTEITFAALHCLVLHDVREACLTLYAFVMPTDILSSH